MDAQAVKDFTELLIVARRAMDEYLLSGDLHGVACAAGILTSRINNLTAIVAAYDTREPNDKDKFEFSSLASTLKWLSEDKDVTKSFAGITLCLPDTAFKAVHPGVGLSGEVTWSETIAMLQKAMVEVVLEGLPTPLSA